MKISITSDVHVMAQDEDAGKKFLQNFLYNDYVVNSDVIVFLGDIFDIMIGPKTQYLKRYHFFFEAIKKLASEGKKIVYIEGNHDFHIEKVFKELNTNNIEVISKRFVLEDAGKKIAFEHGDELDLDNVAYQKWKKIYSSKTMKFLVSFLIPHFVIDNIGKMASSNSKEKSSKEFNFDKEKEKYREHFKRYHTPDIDIYVMGHTHIRDEFIDNNKVYLNNGFPRADQDFLYLEDAQWKRIKV